MARIETDTRPHGGHMNARFAGMVADHRRTCSACPTQYEGTLVDGRTFYFRFRFARATLGVGATIDQAVCDPAETCIGYGDHPMDGSIDEAEFQRLFVELMDLRADARG